MNQVFLALKNDAHHNFLTNHSSFLNVILFNKKKLKSNFSITYEFLNLQLKYIMNCYVQQNVILCKFSPKLCEIKGIFRCTVKLSCNDHGLYEFPSIMKKRRQNFAHNL